MLKALDQRLLEFLFGVFVFQAEKFQYERVPDVFVGATRSGTTT